MKFTYNPKKIRERGLHQMRFELGDTAVKEGALGCALCDEEYLAFLEGLGGGERAWAEVKLEIVRGMLSKFAFQVDVEIDVLHYDFSARVGHWEKICQDLEQELARFSVPVLIGKVKSPYFRTGMMSGGSDKGGRKCF